MLKLRPKLTAEEKRRMTGSGSRYKYIEIGDVTQYGLITKFTEDTLDQLPTRGEYMVRKGDVLLALNNSSRGTVVLVTDDFDGAICTSGFLVIVPENEDMGLLLWYSLRSEICRKQIYYLAQTASQPELKPEAWNDHFNIPLPLGKKRAEALKKAREFHEYLQNLSNVQNYRFSL